MIINHSNGRWISNTYSALANIMTAFAQHGPGRLPEQKNTEIEAEYYRYRDNYNSSFVTYELLLHFIFSILNYSFLNIFPSDTNKLRLGFMVPQPPFASVSCSTKNACP